ncbi:type II toxin-antitoxin system VapC family toxin [Burkholderia gladioli]|uniref:PilT protein-like protein n=1 Tax=Burkholderia gladioli (strain BSR3) TaxID=999541 RepID=F2LRT4_BURGS|nr:type II toxin-antitoxin system VapC family toxin [Burkholderia gladioli]AEA65578.1 PilT protein-like protein [Burkholderia gladioli BSR3]MBW5288095.1 type II toxin-antitoxin system VapC family toxin [Burkholderia gladioli]
MYLLDTCVVSALRRPDKADPSVLTWAKSVSVVQQYISAVTILELEQGVLAQERKDAAQGRVMREWLDGIVRPHFAGRIVPFDEQVALCCAYLHVPNPKSYRDSMIGASGLTRGLTVVTRNTADFIHMVDSRGVPIKLHNPWI